MQEEIFGPILPVIGYETIEDVIQMVQSRPKPLALYLFTNEKRYRGTSSAGFHLAEDVSMTR